MVIRQRARRVNEMHDGSVFVSKDSEEQSIRHAFRPKQAILAKQVICAGDHKCGDRLVPVVVHRMRFHRTVRIGPVLGRIAHSRHQTRFAGKRERRSLSISDGRTPQDSRYQIL